MPKAKPCGSTTTASLTLIASISLRYVYMYVPIIFIHCTRACPVEYSCVVDSSRFWFILTVIFTCPFCRKWGFEKLVYKYSKTEIRRDHKYGVQPPSVFATEVHMSENTVGKTTHKTEGWIMYYHYHGTISKRREPCRKMVNGSIVKWKDSDMWWTPQ